MADIFIEVDFVNPISLCITNFTETDLRRIVLGLLVNLLWSTSLITVVLDSYLMDGHTL